MRCRVFGVGIIRDTHFAAGRCCVRFDFGYAVIQVRDISPETSSNASELRDAILRAGFYVGDPVLTPFGCGHILSIQKRRRCLTGRISVQDALHPDGVLKVQLLAGDSRSGAGRDEAGTAFVQFAHTTLNY